MTPEHTGIFSLHVRCDHKDATVTVVDDGQGISNEVLRGAFELALARRDGQRTYSARLELAAPAAAAPSPHRAGARRRILVVDDHVDAAQSLALLLRTLGHDVQVAHDGHAALEAARTNRPQLVLLDLSMPGVDGYRVLERLRRDPSFDRVPFVAVTGAGSHEDHLRSREAGFHDHLVKPVSVETLRALLEKLQ